MKMIHGMVQTNSTIYVAMTKKPIDIVSALCEDDQKEWKVAKKFINCKCRKPRRLTISPVGPFQDHEVTICQKCETILRDYPIVEKDDLPKGFVRKTILNAYGEEMELVTADDSAEGKELKNKAKRMLEQDHTWHGDNFFETLK